MSSAVSTAGPHQAAIALGSNLPSCFGSREGTLQEAIRRLTEFGRVTAVSSFRDTAPVGLTEQPRFLNAAVLLETELQPVQLLRVLLEAERAMGRKRDGIPNKGPRIIDLDLIWFDDLVMDTLELILPHPAMADRRFVLEPLAEIEPGWVHPVLRVRVAELLARIS